MSLKINEFSNKPILCCDLLSFLKKVDSLFNPILSKRTDLHLFSKKLIELSEIVYITTDESDNIIGLISFYANDFTTKIAYITLVAVVPEYQGNGLSKIMLQKCEGICKKKGMHFIDLHTHSKNSKAINLYESKSFCRQSICINDRIHFRRNIYRKTS